NYFWRCLAEGAPTTVSPTVAVRGGAEPVHAAVAVRPVSVADLQPAATAYRSYVRPKLASMLEQVRAVRAEISGGDVATARRDWLGAQLTWERVGAAYGSFGALGDAIDGLPQALPRGVHDPGFTGLHRLEYGLWHGQSAATLTLVCSRLIADIETLSAKLPQVTIDPTDLPIRAHEILEDALRDHLNGMTDEGAGAAYPETYADVQGTRVVLGELAPLVNQRRPHLLATIRPQLSALSRALLATKAHGSWRSPASTPLAERQLVNARIGAVLENLSIVPDLLEVPAH
ncbi:MAG: EfeM/EfeO family lipoprotein, partial [Sciscionella sp.]